MQLRLVDTEPQADFDAFWQTWPHKVGKKDARKAWSQAMKHHDPQAIVAGVERYKQHKPDWQAWMHPATYIRGERWEDEYSDDVAAAIDGLFQ